ncbi:MAG TPA: thioredoxin domain-containing protein [Anaerolineales bacterium]|nr:thioredoxin domain-containing protein [Anaerolineales bacterium]
MSPEKKNKRQRIKEKNQQQQRNRIIMIVMMVVGAALFVYAFLSSTIQSVGEIVVPELHDLSNANGLALGDPNAPVTIDIFEDFQCSACKYFTETIEPLVIEYFVDTGKARLVFHHYPFLDGDGAFNGGNSDQAANATMCASEQNRFWDMQAVIFANLTGEHSGNFSDQRLKAMAEAIDLDTDAFNTCFDSNKYRDQIQADFEYGQELGVLGTPVVYVNREKVGEPGKIPTFQEIAVAVDAIVNAAE